jgi:ABC-type siderophore export system fused ATPase/permease subunit
MKIPAERPWWADHIPDIRAWSTAAMFGLVFYVLWLIASYPELKTNELFKTVATLLIGSGAFGLVCAFLWGGSKASVAAADTVNAMATSNAAAAAPVAPTVAPPMQPAP